MNSASGLAGALLLAALVAAPAPAQTPAPNTAPTLSRQQRAALQSIVRAMDDGAGRIVSNGDWQFHVMRASDGSHYVAFSLPAAGLPVDRPLALYVRLATRPVAGTVPVTERSALAEWLAGQTTTMAMNQRGLALGDMPTYGAAGISSRGSATVGSQSLQLLELERQRARERREAEERERQATLAGEGAGRGPRPMLPFEDFDVRAMAIPDARGVATLRRGLSAGPGDYDLVVGWADPAARDVAATVGVARLRISLPPASATDFGLSSVIMADAVTFHDTPPVSTEQAAHPYRIGIMDITPAADDVYQTTERLALAVQVINAHGAGGKPDVVVGFRLFRRQGQREESLGTMAPQFYNAETLPADFDTTRNHPIFAAVAVPLSSFKRGDYRFEVVANDRVAGVGATVSTRFTIAATPSMLLREAPPLASPFRRDDVLQPALLGELLRLLAPAQPSNVMATAIEHARARRFVELVRDEPVEPHEAAARGTLRLLALYAIGDATASLQAQLRQSPGQPAAPAEHILMGAAHALAGRDRDASAAWESAIAAGADLAAVAPVLIDALIRQGDTARALDVAGRSTTTVATDPGAIHRAAAAHVAAARYAEALALAEQRLARQPDDAGAQWLALHALFAGFAADSGPGAGAAGRARMLELADAYTAANGPHAALARAWADAVRAASH